MVYAAQQSVAIALALSVVQTFELLLSIKDDMSANLAYEPFLPGFGHFMR